MAGNDDLGEFLRARRARTRPEDVGLPAAGPNRRVPGLRREELALLAGVSADYYTRLEQGRHITPSDGVLRAIAGALRLDEAESAHLIELVRREPRGSKRPPVDGIQQVRPGVLRLMDSLVDQPAFVLGRRTDVLAANRLCRALMADFPAMPAAERNMTRWIILDPAARDRYPDWELVAPEVVGTLRVDAGRYPDDPRTAALVDELLGKSEHFQRWWADHRVVERSFGTKRLCHRVFGEIEIDYEAMTLAADADQTLFIYSTRPASPSREAMQSLARWAASNDQLQQHDEAEGHQ